MSPMPATCPACLILLGLITLIMLCEVYRYKICVSVREMSLEVPLLALKSAVTFDILGSDPNIFCVRVSTVAERVNCLTNGAP